MASVWVIFFPAVEFHLWNVTISVAGSIPSSCRESSGTGHPEPGLQIPLSLHSGFAFILELFFWGDSHLIDHHSFSFSLLLQGSHTHTFGVKKQLILKDEPEAKPLDWPWQEWPALGSCTNTLLPSLWDFHLSCWTPLLSPRPQKWREGMNTLEILNKLYFLVF